MEERVRRVEGDMHVLKGWRQDNVDPWIKESRTFNSEFKTFMDRLLERDAVREKLDDERHNANSSKMNVIITLATVMLAMIALATLILSIAAMKHQISDIMPFNFSQSSQPALSSMQPTQQLAGDPPAYITGR